MMPGLISGNHSFSTESLPSVRTNTSGTKDTLAWRTSFRRARHGGLQTSCLFDCKF
jgi:hypothetical protein